MARKKITEYHAKNIVFSRVLGRQYQGIKVLAQDPTSLSKQLQELPKNQKYVIKVDQGIKKRGKSGLLKLDISATDVLDAVQELSEKGYSQFVVEPFVPHANSQEAYLALQLTRDGYQWIYSHQGGVDVEAHAQEIEKLEADQTSRVARALGCPEDFLQKILDVAKQNHFVYLEINPLLIDDNQVHILDLAVEVDSVAEFFAPDWDMHSYALPIGKHLTTQEQTIVKLDSESQASLKLNVINEEGSIWMLLSGGGASLVLADELFNLGKGQLLGNYGEYSGNPNREETRIYTHNVLELLLASPVGDKALVIAGGVANFTDVRITFRGVIDALKQHLEELQKQEVKIFVRRGGPNQEEALQEMQQFLSKNQLLVEYSEQDKRAVNGPELPLVEVVNLALAEIKS